MATELNAATATQPIITKHIDGFRVAIVTADWNPSITYALRDGAIDVLKRSGYTDDAYDTYSVPGTVELTFAAAQLCKSKKYDAVIVIGCVIRGDTPHFDYVCDSVTQGVAQLNATQDVPVVFGVITVENEQQAIDRAGGRLGNKGAECADVAVKMFDFILQIKK